MEKNTIHVQETVIETIAQALHIAQEKINLNSKFEDIKLDSILFIKIVVDCEAKLGVEFEDEKLFVEEFEDVSSFVKYINTLL